MYLYRGFFSKNKEFYNKLIIVWVQNFAGLKFHVFVETSLLLNFLRFFCGFVMDVITTPFSGLVVRWYSWISKQVMVKENNTVSLQWSVNG